MRPLQHVSHSPFDVVARLVATKAAPPCGRFLQQFAIPSLILRQSRSLAPPTKYFDNNRLPYRTTTRIAIFDSRRLLSSSRKCFEQRPPPPTPKDPIDPPLSPKFPETTPRTHEVAGSDSRVPEEDLPSHRAGQRWQLSKRVASLVDKLQSDLIIASQRLNNYTGTDYSGIEALRQEIKDREQIVKTCHSALARATERYDAALSQQASSQKEVVGLLERKHSWVASDLERYMSLIRSEHTNEQAVQAAKEERMAAERALEEARARLEKIERTQYHEEQIWSDTIRRNSTWVTFGLVGFNILLLLASLVIIEPWRRRRLVREIKGALDERAVGGQGVAAALVNPAVEKEIDAVVEPAGVSAETLEKGQEAETVTPIVAEAAEAAEVTPAAESTGQGVQDAASTVDEAMPSILDTEPLPPTATEASESPSTPTLQAPAAGSWSELLERWKLYFRDLFSERQITLRKVDLTTTALEGAAAGAAFMGFLFVLLRPR